MEASYEGLSEFHGTSKLNFLDAEKTMKLDGFSGAPVFAFEQLDPKTIKAGFVGMMIRARYFMNSEVIIRALNKVYAHDV